jgi:xanthine dehydrogenase YagR molybdenum-binding subunit
MATISWPKMGTASLLGKPQDRIDGQDKASGAAKYTYDIVPDKTLIARVLGCPHGHARIKSIDVSPAKKVAGVVEAQAIKQAGAECNWHGDLVAVVVGETEGAVAEGLAAIKIDYDELDAFVKEEDLAAATKAGRTKPGGRAVQLPGDPGDDDEAADREVDKLLKASDVVVDGYYGIQVITHMCLEPHGTTCEWSGDKLTAHLSTQNVSGTAGQFGTPLGIPASDVTVHCDYIGGGFGSKFQADSWGVLCAQLAKKLGRPVKLMLDRDLELKNAGNRPSGFLRVKVGADKDGVVKVWDSQHWSTGGFGGGGIVSAGVIPYVFVPPNFRKRVTAISTNASPQRAWRAPNHPQGCAITQTAYDDIARKLGISSYDVFRRNIEAIPAGPGTAMAYRKETYLAEMEKAGELIGWKDKWHAHGKGRARGSVVEGLGMAIHTWGGGAVASSCTIKIHPDGGVETFQGSQDLGTGTRTVINMVIAETLGLPMNAVKVNIGSSKYPQANPSGGSITVGSVSEANRRGATDALNQLLAKAAPKLGTTADKLEAKNSRIQVIGDADKSLSWKEACALLGVTPIEATGRHAGGASELSSSQVAGVQMAEVAVDKETGVVKMKKFVAVQDMGLIINPKTAESQIYGAVIMGIAYALFEERIMDAKSGKFVNAELADYKLPRLGDVGEIVVHLWQPESEYKRGVIGLGEPPVISPGAAISNAVCNALGVRVPVLPLTPKRVLDALKETA